jgi:large subunit ribosomal protein L10
MLSKKYFKTHLYKENEAKDLVLFVQYSDYSIKEWDLLKRQCLENGFNITRIKNTVMSKALMGGSYEKLESSFHGSMAVFSCVGDFSPSLLKAIIKVIEDQSKMELVSALLHEKIIFPGTLQKWSELPEEAELYSSFVHLLNRPVQSLVKLQNQGINTICSDLSKYVELGDQ